MVAKSSLLLAWLAVLNECCAETNCNRSFMIKSQKDVDDLQDCPRIKGDILISRQATGDLKIDGVKGIKGSIKNEICESCSPQTAEITSLTCDVIEVTRLELTNLTKLKSIKFPQQEGQSAFPFYNEPKVQPFDTVLDFVKLQDLPALETFEAKSLHDPIALHLENLPKLKNLAVNKDNFNVGFLTGDAPESGTFIRNVGLDSLNNMLDTSITQYAETTHVDIRDMPNINDIRLSLQVAKNISFVGNGDRHFQIAHAEDGPIKYEAYLRVYDRLELEGISNFTYNFNWNEFGLSIGDFVIRNTKIKELKLDHMDLQNVVFQNNANLTAIFPEIERENRLQSLVVSNNPRLILKGDTNFTQYLWQNEEGRNPMDLMSLTGHVESSFFDGFLSQFIRIRNITVDSTVSDFNCSALEEAVGPKIHRLDCQGKVTQAPESRAVMLSQASWSLFVVLFATLYITC